MKIILNVLFILFLFFCSAQETTKNLIVPKLNTGVYGDSLTRIISAGPEGATIRFATKEYGKAFWNQDSLANYVIKKYELDSTSSSYDLAISVGEFMKSGALKDHIKSFGRSAILIKEDSSMVSIDDDLMQLSTYPNGNSGDFSRSFCSLAAYLSNYLGTSSRFALIDFNGYSAAEYFDEELKKWVIVDPDPQSRMFIPKINGKALSVEELLENPDLVLQDDNLLLGKHVNAFDSIMVFLNYKNIKNGISSTEKLNRKEVENENLGFDYFIQLAPGQSLKWTYIVDALYIDNKTCSKEILKVFNRFQEGDSAKVMAALMNYSNCLNVNSDHLVLGFARENPLFSDSTFYGKDKSRNNVFTTTLPKGIYTESQIYIPHYIKSLKGNVQLQGSSINGQFEVSLFNFDMETQDRDSYVFETDLRNLGAKFNVESDSAIVEFYSNDKLNFEVYQASEIVVVQGDIEVVQWQNKELKFKASSKKD